MNKNKREKAFWNKYFNFPNDPSGIPSAINHINFNCTDVDDEDMGFLVSRIKTIEILDLELTQISNAGVAAIATLQGLKELKLKDNEPVTNDCVADLNKLTGLEMLHVSHTSINIDGVLQLTALQNLQRLFFSENNVDAIKEKMLQLKTILPHCEFIVNGQVYQFDVMTNVAYAIKECHGGYRIKIRNQPLGNDWSNWLTTAGNDHYETEKQGSSAIDDIEWVEINPIEKRKEGELVTEKEIDHTAAIIKLLEDLLVPAMETNGVIRIYFTKRYKN